MGIIRKGVLGGFRNKVGTVVGSSWRSLDVIRSLPKISKKPKTQAQLDVQAKFKLVTDVLTPISSLIEVGFKAASRIKTARNVAFEAHIAAAITGISPNFIFNYQALLFSKGSLAEAADAQVQTVTGSKMKFSWACDYDEPKDAPTDLVTFLLYNPSLDKWVKLQNAAPRSAKMFTVQMPAAFMGTEVMSYIAFSSATIKNLVSNSTYIATLTAV